MIFHTEYLLELYPKTSEKVSSARSQDIKSTQKIALLHTNNEHVEVELKHIHL